MECAFASQIVSSYLNGQKPVMEMLPEPLSDIAGLQVEVLSIGGERVSSLRVDLLGCAEGRHGSIFWSSNIQLAFCNVY